MKDCNTVILLMLLFGLVYSFPSNYFSTNDAENIQQMIISSQKTDGSFGDLKNTFYAVSSLTKLQVTVPKKEKLCDYVKTTDIASTESAFYYASISEALSCGFSASDQITKVIHSGLKKDDFSNLYYGSEAAFLLKEKKHITIDEKEQMKALQGLLDLGQDDGTFMEQEDGDYGTKINTGLALQVFSKAVRSLKLSKELKDKISDVLKNSASLQAHLGENTLEFFDEENRFSNIRITASILKGVVDLTNSLGLRSLPFPSDQILLFAEFFIQNKQAVSLEGAHFLLEGLDAVANNNIAAPLVLTLPKTSFSVSSKGNEGNLKVSLTDLYGKFATKAKIILIQASVIKENAKPLISNQEVYHSEKENYQTNFMATKPEPAAYSLIFRVIPENKKFVAAESITRTIKVVGSAVISKASLVIADSSDIVDLHDGKSFSPNYPDTLTETIPVEHFQHLYLNFKVTSAGKPIEPHQVFVSLVNSETKKELFVVAKPKAGEHKTHLNIGKTVETFGGKSGKYELYVFVGDSLIDNSFSWRVANLDIKYPADFKIESQPSPFEPKPEISWTFRQPENRPPKAISMGFTLAVLSPILVLLIGLIKVGANVSNFPTGGNFIFALGFEIGLGMILALYALYWLRLNMIQTLYYLFLIGIPTYFCAVNLLKNLPPSTKTKED